MTREEAILLSAYTGYLLAPDFSQVHKFCEDTLGRPIWTHEFADRCVQKEIREKLHPQIMELVQNIAALRPVSREQVAEVWKGCDLCLDDSWQRSLMIPKRFDHTNMLSTELAQFCPGCGRPLTDKAVDMVMERLEEVLKDGN